LEGAGAGRICGTTGSQLRPHFISRSLPDEAHGTVLADCIDGGACPEKDKRPDPEERVCKFPTGPGQVELQPGKVRMKQSHKRKPRKQTTIHGAPLGERMNASNGEMRRKLQSEDSVWKCGESRSLRALISERLPICSCTPRRDSQTVPALRVAPRRAESMPYRSIRQAAALGRVYAARFPNAHHAPGWFCSNFNAVALTANATDQFSAVRGSDPAYSNDHTGLASVSN